MVVERNQSPIRTLITSTAPARENGPRLGKRPPPGQTVLRGKSLLLGGIPVFGLLYGRVGAGYDSANTGK